MKNRVILLVSAMCAGVLVWSAVQTGAADKPKNPTTKPAEWKLPKGTQVQPNCFHVTPDGKYVFYDEKKTTPEDKKAGRSGTTLYWVFEPRTGKRTDVRDLAGRQHKGRIILVTPSPSGKYVAIVIAKPSKRSFLTMKLLLVSLESRKVRVIRSWVMGSLCWVGEKFAVNTVKKDGLQPIRLINPAGRARTLRKVRGLVCGADEKGKVMVCACDAKNPGAPIFVVDVHKKQIVVMTVKGKILRILDETDTAMSFAVSPKGKYVAFQKLQTPWEPRQPVLVSHIEVMAVEGKETWKIDDKAEPIAVSDTGTVVTIGTVFGPNGARIKIWDKQGKSRTLVAGAQAATISGGRLFYVTPGKQPVIKSMPLPSSKKPTTQPGSATTSE